MFGYIKGSEHHNAPVKRKMAGAREEGGPAKRQCGGAEIVVFMRWYIFPSPVLAGFSALCYVFTAESGGLSSSLSAARCKFLKLSAARASSSASRSRSIFGSDGGVGW